MENQCPLQTLFAEHPCACRRAGQDSQSCCGLAFAKYLAYRCEDAAALAEDLRRLLGRARTDERPADKP